MVGNRTVAIIDLYNNQFWCNFLWSYEHLRMEIHPTGKLTTVNEDCMFHFERIGEDTIRLRSVRVPYISLQPPFNSYNRCVHKLYVLNKHTTGSQ